MSIILTILKILGIILLVILGVILLLILLILFVPIRYRAEGKLENGEKPQLSARITWAFPVIAFRIRYAGELEYGLRVLGIRIFPGKGTKSGDAKKQKSPAETPNQHELSETGANSQSTDSDTNKATTDSDIHHADQDPTDQPAADTPTQEPQDPPPSGLIDKLDHYLQKFLGWLEQLQENAENAVQSLCEKISSVKAKIDHYLGILNARYTQELLAKLWNVLGRILSHIKPRKFSASLTIGTGDPASTGNILAIHGMLYPLIGDHISITGDFENKYTAGDFFLKGRIRLAVLLYHSLRILLDRRFHKLLGQLKKGGTN